MKKNVYFLSDAHLGSLALPHARTRERRLVRFLDEIKDKASAIYLLGDIFDFWNEYRYVVPKGFTRFLGKISELTDSGVEVHFFIGNHDIWTYGYLEEECGMIVHKKPATLEILGKQFYLAHGDGLGDPSKKFQFIRKMFHSRFCQIALNTIHPRWGMALGLNWSKHSRISHGTSETEPAEPYKGERKEILVDYSKEYLKTHPDIDYFIYGHRHIELDLMLTKKARLMILGDWIYQFTYVVFDGEHIMMQEYVEGESKP